MEEPQIRFKRVKIDYIYFKDFIAEDFKVYPMTESIRKTRNRAIIF